MLENLSSGPCLTAGCSTVLITFAARLLESLASMAAILSELSFRSAKAWPQIGPRLHLCAPSGGHRHSPEHLVSTLSPWLSPLAVA